MESKKRSTERESHFLEMDERQHKQEYAQIGINTPVSSERIARGLVGSSERRIRSACSPAVTSKRFGADSNASAPANPATVERPCAADGVGSVPRGDNSGKREDLELQSATRPKRVISVSGSLLGGPDRRGRRRQTEEDVEALGEKLLTADQDPESQQAQNTDQPTMALPTSKAPISPALGSPF